MQLAMRSIFLVCAICISASNGRRAKPHVSALARKLRQPVQTRKVFSDFSRLLLAVSPIGTRRLHHRTRRPATLKLKDQIRGGPLRSSRHVDGGLGPEKLKIALQKRPPTTSAEMAAAKDDKVLYAIRKVEEDMGILDVLTSRKPQLSNAELSLLSLAVFVSYASPFLLPGKVVELLVPFMGTFCASVGFSAEFTGKVAVAKGKEIAAITLQAAAEAEELLAQAEREKALIPFCVGVSATASAFALLMPAVVPRLARSGVAAIFLAQLTLIPPLVALLSAVLSHLARQQVNSAAYNAINLGSRRFADSSKVGRTWLSATEQISESDTRASSKWRSLSKVVLPAPLIASLTPGSLAFKSIITTAIFAAQAAYYLASAEYVVSACVESVAKKFRASAVSDTYANQGARAGAILPFTSALSGLTAALTVASVEFLSAVPSVPLESFICGAFPTLGALLASAASISKAQTEVDANAAKVAATELADTDKVPASDPKTLSRKTLDLIQLTMGQLSARKRLSKFLIRFRRASPQKQS